MYKSIILFFSFFFVINVFAQSYSGKQRSLQLNDDQLARLYDGPADLNKMADLFFPMDYKDIMNKAKAQSVDPEIMEGTIYIDGKLFRMDMMSMGQKMSAIINLDTREIYSIMHDRKEYYVMNIDEMKAMQAQFKENMAAQMENMKGMMDNLPAEAREMMEKMAGKKNSIPPKITKTGNTKTVNGFSCVEYLVSKENSRERLWITTENSSWRDAFYELATSMPMSEEETQAEWDIIKEGWPVQTSSVEGAGEYTEGSFSFHEVYELKEAPLKEGTFDPPAGYTKKTMQDMMGGMPGYQN